MSVGRMGLPLWHPEGRVQPSPGPCWLPAALRGWLNGWLLLTQGLEYGGIPAMGTPDVAHSELESHAGSRGWWSGCQIFG